MNIADTLTTMQAIRYHKYGGPEELLLENARIPVPKAGQVLIHNRASSVNPYDWKQRAGIYKEWESLEFPFIPGVESSGIIESVSSDVEGFEEGDYVFGISPNSYAEYSVTSVKDLMHKPDYMTFEEAAATYIGAQTAWSSLFDKAGLNEGQHILIHGGAGSVGIFAIQLAKWRGAIVSATSSSGNIDFLQSLGADNVIDYKAQIFENVLKDVDVVLDTIGGETQERSFLALKKGGLLVSVISQPSVDLAKKFGVKAHLRTGGISTEGQQEIQRLVDYGTIKPVVRKVFTLAEAGLAQEMSQSGHGRGKIVLKIPV